MPNPNNPDLNDWVNEISRLVEANKRDQIYLVGHSLGVPTILRYLENTSAQNVRGAVLVSGPVFKTTKKAVAKFLEKPFEFQKIKSNIDKVVVIHGSNDMNVSLDQGETLAKELNAKLIIIENGGHLNGSAGWLKLPQCLTALNEIMR